MDFRRSGILSSLVLWLLALALVWLAVPAALVAAPSHPQQVDGLFTPSEVRGPAVQADHPAAVRSRSVQVEVARVAEAVSLPEGQPLTLNLFEDVALTAVPDRVGRSPQGGISWVGRVEGQLLSQVVLVVEEGVLAGAVIMPGAQYQIRYLGDGLYTVLEIDQAAFGEELEPIPVDASQEAAEATPGSALADSGSTIDLLVVYTPAARAAAGGTTAIRSEISLAVEQTNDSYVRSQVAQRLRLVHAAEVSYLESGEFPTDLERLRDTVDPYLTTVHSLRNAYRADEVLLLVHYSSNPYCGIAYFMDTVTVGFEDWAFAVVELDCAAAYYTFGHELGHNMGGRHDWYMDAGTTPYTHSHGYANVAGGWRTMMAYNDGCLAVGTSCTRLPNWSNPAVYYGGRATGVPEGTSTSCTTGVPYAYCDADNARTLNKTAYTVANFRPSLSAPTGLAATAVAPTQVNLAWTDTSPDETGFRLERSLDGLSAWTQIAAVGANVTAYSDTGLLAGTAYHYRVRAYDAYVSSIYSGVAQAITPQGPGPLVSSGHRVDDDDVDHSLGNGDGIADCGETVELYVALRNEGSSTAEGVAVEISSSDPKVSILYNQGSGYGDIPAAGTAVNTDDFDVAVAPDLPWGYRARFDLVATATNGGPWSDSFTLMVQCGEAPHSVYLPLGARQFVSGFDAQFKGSAPGWDAHSGGWSIANGEWYTTEGLASAWATTSYEIEYEDLDYEARLYRTGCDNCASGLMVRGEPHPLAGANAWNSGYGFFISQDGRFAIYRYDGGVPSLLQAWTLSSAINPGSVWNTLRVVAAGSSLRFYINGSLVWSGNNAAHASGRVGLAMYRDADSTSNQLWVDWAKLAPVVTAAAGETLTAEQRALNVAAVQVEGGGSAGQAPGQIGANLEDRPPE